MDIAKCIAEFQNHQMDILLNSGRTFFRLGKYYECLATEDMDYFFMMIRGTGQSGSSIFYGSCLPKVCPPQIVKEGVNLALNFSGIPFEIQNISTKINETRQPFNLAFFITFFMISVLLTLVISSTLSKKIGQHKYLSAFSLQLTSKSLQYHQRSQLNILSGLKSLSMFWVVYGHTMLMGIGYSENIISIESVLSDWRFLTVSTGFYSVDTFFFVGGFLLAYSFLKENSKKNVKYFLAILNRFLRFIPAYLVAIMIFYSVFPHLGNGPFWQGSMAKSKYCHSLWRPLLFVDNLVEAGNNMCMQWGWYLQNDMQMFILSVVILFIYQKSRFISFLTIFLVISANFAFVMAETFENKQKWMNHLSDTLKNDRYQNLIYYQPWGRCPPYLYGLLLGILVRQLVKFEQNQKQMKSSEYIQKAPAMHHLKKYLLDHNYVRRSLQFFGLLMCFFISLIQRTNQGQMYWSQLSHSLYLTYGKLLFVFGLSLIVLPSLILPIQQNMLVRFLLDTKFFNFIAKISYSTYLIHMTLLLIFFGSSKYDSYYSFYPNFTYFATFLVLSLVSGLLLFYIVEQPFSQLQKSLMKKLLKVGMKQAENEGKLQKDAKVIPQQ